MLQVRAFLECYKEKTWLGKSNFPCWPEIDAIALLVNQSHEWKLDL